MEKILIVFCFYAGLFACATLQPTSELASEVAQPVTKTYTSPKISGLNARQPFPGPHDVCVVLNSNALADQFELENHFLIACPDHEKGAIDDRIRLQQAEVAGHAKHWVVMRVPFAEPAGWSA